MCLTMHRGMHGWPSKLVMLFFVTNTQSISDGLTSCEADTCGAFMRCGVSQRNRSIRGVGTTIATYLRVDVAALAELVAGSRS